MFDSEEKKMLIELMHSINSITIYERRLIINRIDRLEKNLNKRLTELENIIEHEKQFNMLMDRLENRIDKIVVKKQNAN